MTTIDAEPSAIAEVLARLERVISIYDNDSLISVLGTKHLNKLCQNLL